MKILTVIAVIISALLAISACDGKPYVDPHPEISKRMKEAEHLSGFKSVAILVETYSAEKHKENNRAQPDDPRYVIIFSPEPGAYIYIYERDLGEVGLRVSGLSIKHMKANNVIRQDFSGKFGWMRDTYALEYERRSP